MQKFLAFIILFLVFVSVDAHTGSVSGSVKDASTGEPLIGATIKLMDSTKMIKGVVTDVFGKFRFEKVLTGSYRIEVSYVGFQMKSFNQLVEADKINSMQISLEPGLLLLSDIMVLGTSANQDMSTISDVDINVRPIDNAQDVLRLVPGLFIAQHAGGGKAEQIFLRGFDIDHGTDINLTVDGMPVNMVSHAHGQGYSDLHFVIPETIDNVDFNKGPYNIRKGDFATAGFAAFQTKNSLDKNLVKIEGGQFNTLRALTMFKLIDQDKDDVNQQAYIATEYFLSDGYFDSPQNFNRLNMMGKYTLRAGDNQSLTIMASTFSSRWNASGQIPERAVEQGLVSRFGSLSKEGGETARSNFTIQYKKLLANGGITNQQVYFSKYDFRLVSNFTFFLNDPVNGDQITQQESRKIYGYTGEYTKENYVGNAVALTEAGIGFRYDDVNDIHLAHTLNQNTLLGYAARGDIDQTNAHAFVNETVTFANHFSISGGVRVDAFQFLYNDFLTTSAQRPGVLKTVISPKLSFNYTASPSTAFYLKTGYGFHSNDARVVTLQDGKSILPKALGADLGTIWKPTTDVIIQAAFWVLDSEQEFVYVGDAGIVEPSGSSLRKGVDVSVRGQLLKNIYLDTDLNYAQPRFKNTPEGLNYVPLAPTLTSAGGISYQSKQGLQGSVRYRYMADRAANEDKSVIANGYTVMDMTINYVFTNFTIHLSCQNFLNTEWKEAQFDTESRLKDEAAPVSEIHFTPGTPRFVKAGVGWKF